jgi:hypothetical protein
MLKLDACPVRKNLLGVDVEIWHDAQPYDRTDRGPIREVSHDVGFRDPAADGHSTFYRLHLKETVGRVQGQRCEGQI